MDDYITTQPSSFRSTQSNYMCKKELEANEYLNFVQSDDQFIQLPQLESPSLQSIKRPISSIYENNQEDNQIKRRNINNNNNNSNDYGTDVNKVRDWRALDNFVASQLSQEEEIQCLGERFSSTFEENHDSDLNFMFSQGSREEDGGGEGGKGAKSNGFMSSTSSDHFDIGVCIFDNL